MFRSFTLLGGVGLLLFWFAGLGRTAESSLLWWDLGLGLAAAVFAGQLKPTTSRTLKAGVPFTISLLLLLVWGAALAVGAPSWLAWWNFAFAMVFLTLGTFAATSRDLRIGQRDYPMTPWGEVTFPYLGYGTGVGFFRRSDSRIGEDIHARLTAHPEVDAQDIEVHVHNGEVTLTGFVANEHKRRIAQEIAETVPGCSAVRNHLGTSKKLIRKFVVLGFLIAGAAHAETNVGPRGEEAHEIILAGTQGRLAFGQGTTTLSFASGYNYGAMPWLQWGMFPSLTYVSSGGNSTTLVTLLTGPTVNFPAGDWKRALFVTGTAGVTIGNNQTNFTYGADLGKRFLILPNVTYRPSVGLQKVAGNDPSFILNVLSFSAAF